MLSIPAWNDTSYLSLEEIFLILEGSLKGFQWSLHVLEVAPAPESEKLYNINHDMAWSFFDLLKLINPKLQIIDGEIIAKGLDSGYYLLIRAVDSTSWDIDTNIPEIIMSVRQAFPDVEETEDWA